MANAIKELFGSPTAFTITLNSLASSTARVGRASTDVDNTTVRAPKYLISYAIDLGASSSVDKSVQFFLVRNDNNGTPIRSDNHSGSDAGLTVLCSDMIYSCTTKTASEVLRGSFIVQDVGPKFAIAVVHDTGVALESSGHTLTYTAITPEVQ